MLKLPIRIIISLKVIQKSVDDKNNIENHKGSQLFLVHYIILYTDEGHDHDVNNKHNLDHIVPLQVPIVFRDDNKPAFLDIFVMINLINSMLFVLTLEEFLDFFSGIVHWEFVFFTKVVNEANAV